MTRRVALSDFHEAMAAANVVALWELEDTTNNPPEPPHIWRWETLEPLLETAIEATSMTDAERRVLVLNNPALLESGRSRGSGLTLGFNLQVLMPGETARPHRHSMNALRFVMEGSGATTVVDGKPCPMEPGDMVLTPGWTWHEHVHEGDGRMIWLDVLDVPFHHYLDTGEFEPGPAHDLPDLPPDEAFAAPGLAPVSGSADMAYSPLFRYPWETARPALAALPPAPDGSRRLLYTNPLTGGPTMATMECSLLSLAPESTTRAYRSNSNSAFIVVGGEGRSEIGETTLEWRKHDIVSLPHGHWIGHTAETEDAWLFEVSDREMLRRLHILRDEFAAQ